MYDKICNQCTEWTKGVTKIRWGKNDVFHHRVDGWSVRDIVEDRDGTLEQMITKASPNPQTLELQEIRGILIQDTGELPKTPECLPGKLCFPCTGRAKNKNVLSLVNYNDLALMTLRDKWCLMK